MLQKLFSNQNISFSHYIMLLIVFKLLSGLVVSGSSGSVSVHWSDETRDTLPLPHISHMSTMSPVSHLHYLNIPTSTTFLWLTSRVWKIIRNKSSVFSAETSFESRVQSDIANDFENQPIFQTLLGVLGSPRSQLLSFSKCRLTVCATEQA